MLIRRHFIVRVVVISCAISLGYFLKSSLDQYSIEVAISNKNVDAAVNFQSTKSEDKGKAGAKASLLEFFGENEQLLENNVSVEKTKPKDATTADSSSSSKV